MAWSGSVIAAAVVCAIVAHRWLSFSDDNGAEAGLPPPNGAPLTVLTSAELAQWADDAGTLRLALLGQVFDVTAGRKHYGRDGGYAFFTGKDATRAFVSGDFSEAGLVDSVDGLSHADMLGIQSWLDFYHKTYTYKGVLSGRYYHADGQPTAALLAARAAIAVAQQDQAARDAEKQVMPPCNAAWSSAEGRRVWCTGNSGGISRDWTGVPRQLFEAASQPRCVCVPDHLLDDPRLRVYDGCDPSALQCSLPT